MSDKAAQLARLQVNAPAGQTYVQGVGYQPKPTTTTTATINNSANPTLQAPTYTPPTAYNPATDINQFKDLQRQKAIIDLGAKRDTQLSALGQQEAQIKPMYDDKRNMSSVNSQIGAKNFAEYLANRGQSNSGLAGQMEISRMGALQNAYTGYNRDENKAVNDINTQRTDVNNGYASDLASSNMGIEANAMDKLIAARQLQDQQARQDALTKFNNQWNSYTYNNNNSREDARNNVLDTRYNQENYLKSILGQGNSFDYQAEYNKIANDGDPSNDWKLPQLMQARQDKITTQNALDLANKKYQDELKQKELENSRENMKLALQKQETDYATSKPYYSPNTSSTDGIGKESPYFAETNKRLDNIFNSAMKTDEVNTENPYGVGSKYSYTQPGRSEYNSVVDMIEHAPIKDIERYTLYNFYGIPLPAKYNQK